jgi:hypothetical protein
MANHTTDSTLPPANVGKSNKTFSEEQVARALRYMDRLVEKEGGNKSAASRAVGLLQGTGNKLFNERSLGLETMRSIAEHAQVPLEYFLHGAPPELEGLLFARPSKWQPATIVAAIHMAKRIPDPPTRAEWIAILDTTEHTLDEMVRGARRKKR